MCRTFRCGQQSKIYQVNYWTLEALDYVAWPAYFSLIFYDNLLHYITHLFELDKKENISLTASQKKEKLKPYIPLALNSVFGI